MKLHKLKDGAVGRVIGRDRVSVSRYRRGKETPQFDIIEEIFKMSQWNVAPNDWLRPALKKMLGAADGKKLDTHPD